MRPSWTLRDDRTMGSLIRSSCAIIPASSRETVMPHPIYLDYNASTPIAPEVLEVMTAVFRDVHGNALSTHAYGVAARKVVEAARAEVAAAIGAEPDEIVFTSGGTESNNAAILGVADALADRRRHIVTTAIEYAS